MVETEKEFRDEMISNSNNLELTSINDEICPKAPKLRPIRHTEYQCTK
jgi:hypothetical protein